MNLTSVYTGSESFEARGKGFTVRYLDSGNSELFLVDCSFESQCFYKLPKNKNMGCGLVIVAKECLTDYLTQLLYADEVIYDSLRDSDPLIHKVRVAFEDRWLSVDAFYVLPSLAFPFNFYTNTFENITLGDIRELLSCFYPRVSQKA